MRRAGPAGLMAFAAGAALAHPHSYVDQQALLSIGREGVELRVVIMPSAVEGAAIHAHLDRNGNGAVSGEEARAFGDALLAGTHLFLDGRAVPLALVSARVPGAEGMAAGTAPIEVRATGSFGLGAGTRHVIDFAMTFEDLAHDWQIQPFLAPDLVADVQAVERDGTGHRVTVRFASAER